MSMDQKENFEFKAWYKKLLNIHLAIIIGPALLMIVMLVLMDYSKVQFSAKEHRNIILAVAGLVVFSFLTARYIYHVGIKQISKGDKNSGILRRFQSISIIRMAILEAAGLICLILFFLYSDWTLLIYSVLLIMYMILQIPQKRNLRRLLKI